MVTHIRLDRSPYLVKCENLFTIQQAQILRTIGRLAPGLMAKVDGCLRVSLGLN